MLIVGSVPEQETNPIAVACGQRHGRISEVRIASRSKSWKDFRLTMETTSETLQNCLRAVVHHLPSAWHGGGVWTA